MADGSLQMVDVVLDFKDSMIQLILFTLKHTSEYRVQ